MFGESAASLQRERDKLTASLSTKSMELAGRRATAEETQRELLPLATRLVAVENELFSKTSTRSLRQKRGELQSLLDCLSANPGSLSETGQLVQRAEMMSLQNEIRKLDYHLSTGKDGSPRATLKNVLALVAFSAAALFVKELIAHWLR